MPADRLRCVQFGLYMDYGWKNDFQLNGYEEEQRTIRMNIRLSYPKKNDFFPTYSSWLQDLPFVLHCSEWEMANRSSLQ